MFESADIITGEVVKRAFFSSYHRPLKDESEVMSQECRTERAYIPPAELIKDMLRAGEALLAARKARYDTDLVEEGVDPELDPTRDPAVDLVDLQRLGSSVSGRLAEQASAGQKAAADAAKASEKAAFDAAVAAEVEKRVQGGSPGKVP